MIIRVATLRFMRSIAVLGLSMGLAMALTSCSGQSEISSQESDLVQSIGTLDSGNSLSRNLAWSYEKEVPAFPLSVTNYVLKIQKPQDVVRLFEGGSWIVPIEEFNPDMDGGATMSCQPFYWIIRWRSNNPDVEIKVSTGMTDGPYEPFDEIVTGGAGISEGFSCVVPAYQFGQAINGNKSNLVDVNFEYQLWESKPKI